MRNKTLEYYDTNAEKFAAGTVSVDFESVQSKFLQKLSPNAYILDFGCGSGRDAKYFLDRGFRVCAVDGSKELCRLASAYIGIDVKQMLFEELNEKACFDAIWACASILHLPKKELHNVIEKIIKAVKNNGVIYTSFKYGDFEGERNGRYFTYFTPDTFHEYIKDIEEVNIEELWVTPDVRSGREDEKWLNLILRRNS